MQAGRGAMATAEEKAKNTAASAKSGMDKAKASAEEKVEKSTSHHPGQTAVAEQREAARKQGAEMEKHAAKEQNAAERVNTTAGAGYGGTTGGHGTTGAGVGHRNVL